MKTFSRSVITPLFLLLLSWVALPQLAAAQDLEALLSRMTLEEKVGQMTQLTLQAVSETKGEPGVAHVLDRDALHEAIAERHVGSLLNVYDMARTEAEWHMLMGHIDDITRSDSRLGIPVIYGIDAVHGNNYLMEATIFPQNIGLAATWNTDLVAQASRITALETRAVGLTWNFSPVLDVARMPLWSRFFETFGEDPYATAVFGTAAVRAMQEPGPSGYPAVAATGKHFLGYSMPLSGKDRTPAWIPERMLRDIFLPPFQAAMDAGLMTVMINSAEMNGIPVHADKYVLTDLLRGELGFDGIAVTDWEDIGKLVGLHRTAATYKEAVYQSVDAGIDMAMVPYDYTFTDALIELVEEGRISEARINESVRRILSVKKKLGLFDEATSHPTARVDIGSDASHEASLLAARQSMTLLKNTGVLPLTGEPSVLAVGPALENIPMMFGSWTYTWQGTDAAAYPEGIQTLRGELASRYGTHLTTAPWGTTHEVDRLRAMAYASDVAVIALGEVPSVEKPGDIESLLLPGDQVALVRDVAESGVPVVVVLFQNRPRIIRAIEPYADAIVLAYLPGPYGAQAVADVLDGTVNPSGHLPFTYPRFSGSIVPYDHKPSESSDILYGTAAFQPQYPFGHGLSYTEFTYSDLTVDTADFGRNGTVSVRVAVQNTGDRTGRDVAHLFVQDHVASVTPPVRRLRGFTPANLEPGEKVQVAWTLSRDDFSFIGRDMTSLFEPGVFSIHVDTLTQTFELP